MNLHRFVLPALCCVATALACAAQKQALKTAAEVQQRITEACAESLPVLHGVAAAAPTCEQCDKLPRAAALVQAVCDELQR